MMQQLETISDEIIIVGSRYGDFTDVLKPYYEKGEPIEPKDIKTLLGSDVVYLQPVQNSDDPYAVGVFISTEKRLGFVWKDQSPSLREMMSANKKRYYKAHIKRINTKYGLMMAEANLPNRLADDVCRGIGIDEDWAKNIPETMTSITQQSLSLGFALLCDELPEAEVWNDSLENRLTNLKRNLPSDLSAQHVKESLELYDKMRRSSIKEVRDSSDNMLDAYVSRGSERKMKQWANEWLPGFFRDAAEYDLLGLFEAANYTLERVEELLNSAPANLFYLYKYNRERFAYHLYYAALPQNTYNRLLTLLAVREAMLARNGGKGEEVIIGTPIEGIRHCITLLMQEKYGNESLFNQQNHWQAIYRILVDKGYCRDSDFDGFDTFIRSAMPEEINKPYSKGSVKQISQTDFVRPFEEWKYDPLTSKTRKPFERMVAVASRFKSILEENGL